MPVGICALTCILLATGMAGCAAGRAVTFTGTGPAFPHAAGLPAAPAQDLGPRLVIPATGGPPVVGIPLGGNLYAPVTGGPPVVGLPVGP